MFLKEFPVILVFQLVGWWVVVVWARSSIKSKVVHTSTELQSCIDNANPGDVIILSATFTIFYDGEFIAKRNGSEGAPIKIIGGNASRKTKITGKGRGTAFSVVGNNWHLEHLSISGYDLGVMVRGTGNLINGLEIGKVNKAINILGRNNTVNGCSIGTSKLYGIRVQSSGVRLSGNAIQHGSKNSSIIIEKDACCGKVKGNTINGGVSILGRRFIFENNIIDGFMKVSGCENSFRGQVVSSPSIYTDRCTNVEFRGNGGMR